MAKSSGSTKSIGASGASAARTTNEGKRTFPIKKASEREALASQLSTQIEGVSQNNYKNGGMEFIEILIPSTKLSKVIELSPFGKTKSTSKIAKEAEKFAFDKKFGGYIKLVPAVKIGKGVTERWISKKLYDSL